MGLNEKVISLETFTASLLLQSNVPLEMRDDVLRKVVEIFYTDGYISVGEIRKIIHACELSVNPEAISKVGPYDDLYGWARI